MLVVGTEPLMRWAMCQGGAKPEWIATVIRTEADAPFQGSVDGVKQMDAGVRLKPAPQSQSRSTQGAMHRH
ncbi:MAG: hypothetical protein QOJ58_5516, partial [Alphaproteobacteria bacterium]|nr:hypothetical protein [Alphaproteobacteria bacterium]